MIRCQPPSPSAASKSCRLSTRRTWAWIPSSASATRTMSVSCGLSSRWRIRSASRRKFFSMLASGARYHGRRLVDQRPEESHLLDGLHEFLEVHRLDDVGVDPGFVTSNKILFLARGSDHDDGYGLEPWIAFHVSQYFQAVHPRHLQIEQHHGRQAFRISRKFFAPIKVVQHLHAVADHDHLVREVVFLERGKGQFDIFVIVLRQQNAFEG